MCKLLNMKRILLTLLAVLTLLPLSAQTKQSQKDYLDRYNLLVSKLGADGVGIETLLQRWEKDYPEDTDMLLGVLVLSDQEPVGLDRGQGFAEVPRQRPDAHA